MNALQIATMLRYLILAVGSVLVGWGWLGREALEYVADVGNLAGFVGALMAIGTFAWGLWLRRKAGVVADAATLSEVTTIKTDGAMANAVTNSKVVKDELR